MTYPDLLEVLESAARAVDSGATYYRGREADVSLNSHTSSRNLIYVLDTMRGEPDADNRFETWRVSVGFFRQDSTSSESMEVNQVQTNEESRETIFTITHALARAFYSALENEETVMLTGSPSYNQQTRQLSGTFTGWSLDFSVLLDVGCDDISISDAIYKNSDSTLEVSIKRSEVYTAPDITVTDSTGDTYDHPANKDVVCTQGGGGTCVYDVDFNGNPKGSISVINCEDIFINLT